MITDISTEGKLELIEMINRIPADKLFKILSKIDKGNKTFEEIINFIIDECNKISYEEYKE